METKKLANVTTVILLLVLFIFVNTICFAEEQPITFEGVWSAGGIGGSWFASATTSLEIIKGANLPNVDINFKIVPGGGISNPATLASGESDVGYSNSPGLLLFMNSEGPYKGKEQEYDASVLRVVAESFNDDQANLFAAEETGIKTVGDFIQLIKENKPIRLVIGGYNMTDIFCFEKLLEFYGLTLEDIRTAGGKILIGGYTEAANNISDKHADFWWAHTTVDNASVLQASLSRKLVVVEPADDLIEYLHGAVGLNKEIMKGGVNPNIDTDGKVCMKMNTILLARNDVPEDVIYIMTKLLCENYKELHVYESAKVFKPETAGNNVTNIPLHPGAERYYKEMGYSYNPGSPLD